jgi:hypothetical protein
MHNALEDLQIVVFRSGSTSCSATQLQQPRSIKAVPKHVQVSCSQLLGGHMRITHGTCDTDTDHKSV